MTLTQLLVAVGVAIFIAFVIYLIIAEAALAAKRRSAIREWALRNGMAYSEGPSDPNDLVPLMTLQPHDRHIDNQHATNITTGRSSRWDVTLFDLTQRSTHGGDDDVDHAVTTTNKSTVAVFKLSGLAFPHVHCAVFGKAFAGAAEEKLLLAADHRLDVAVPAGDDMPLITPHPGCFLRTRDANAARHLFTPSLYALLEDLSGVTIVAEGSHILIEQAGSIDVARLDNFLATGTAIAECFASS